ncbi:MAG: hypothetical protein QW213_07510 [Thermoproteota archaeon]|nr:hypothetical protein [Candidatus Rehaiarchaeum fermentans]
MSYLEIFRLIEIANSLIVCILLIKPIYVLYKNREDWRKVSIYWGNKFKEDKLEIYLILLAFIILFQAGIFLALGEVFNIFWLEISFYVEGIIIYLIFSIIILRWGMWISKL